jgi:hypothetical protein
MVLRMNLKHGQAMRLGKTAEYTVWRNIHARTSDIENPNYGGRGITVCKRWTSFSSFLADMGSKPTPQHTIERIDNDGNYEPSNCRWATRKEQARNKRRNIRVTRNGETRVISEWAELIGVSCFTLYNRHRQGRDIFSSYRR